MSIPYHLAAQCEIFVILLQETHCTSAQRLVLPDYQLAGFSSRKHGLATFVYERLKWTLFDQSPPTSETVWLCVDVDGYKIVNVYKPPIRLQVSDLPVFPCPCLYTSNCNCQHVDWDYDANSADGKCLVGWANANNLVLLHNPKDAASFHSGRWNTSTNQDLAFVSIDSDSRLPDRHLRKIPKVSTSILAYYSTQVCSSCTKQACKAMELPQGHVEPLYYSHKQTCQDFAATPNSSDIDQAYQCFCNATSTAAKKCIPRGRRNNRIPCWDAECENLYQTFWQYPEVHESSRAATALLDRKRKNRWSEAVRNIEFSLSSRVAWNTLNNLTGRSRRSPRQYLFQQMLLLAS